MEGHPDPSQPRVNFPSPQAEEEEPVQRRSALGRRFRESKNHFPHFGRIERVVEQINKTEPVVTKEMVYERFCEGDSATFWL